jgi:integrase
MTLTDFKTNAIYKSIHQDLPPVLHSLLAHSLSVQPRTFLFTNRMGLPFERNNFSTWASELLEKILQKSFTLTLFRHIYISHLDPSLTPGELQNISKLMGHSLTQQILYRWKTKPETLD